MMYGMAYDLFEGRSIESQEIHFTYENWNFSPILSNVDRRTDAIRLIQACFVASMQSGCNASSWTEPDLSIKYNWTHFRAIRIPIIKIEIDQSTTKAIKNNEKPTPIGETEFFFAIFFFLDCNTNSRISQAFFGWHSKNEIYDDKKLSGFSSKSQFFSSQLF